jgi:hypothetical protein
MAKKPIILQFFDQFFAQIIFKIFSKIQNDPMVGFSMHGIFCVHLKILKKCYQNQKLLEKSQKCKCRVANGEKRLKKDTFSLKLGKMRFYASEVRAIDYSQQITPNGHIYIYIYIKKIFSKIVARCIPFSFQIFEALSTSAIDSDS